MKTRILFVDDEMNVLSGLRRMLRGQRKEWEMEFAGGGKQAREKLVEQEFDVVVSDMRMPCIDGAQLLGGVSTEHPHTIRLVLSGQSEHEKIFRAIPATHQFLSKPCDPELLVATIRRACDSRQTLANQSLQSVVSGLTSLPCLPVNHELLTRELGCESPSIDRVGEIISGDMAMSAKVLQLVHSSYFGTPQCVDSVSKAVSLLGLEIIRPLATKIQSFQPADPTLVDDFGLGEVQRHVTSVAPVAFSIASDHGFSSDEAGHASIAAALHDIGKLVLATHATDDFREAHRIAEEAEVPLWKAEMEVFGTTHAEVGGHLMALWGFPAAIVDAVTHHHRPDNAGHTDFSALTAVYLANTADRQAESGADRRAELIWNDSYLDAIGVNANPEHWAAYV